MQGAFIGGHRPKSKKALKEAVAERPSVVTLEATSLFGGESSGPVEELPQGAVAYVVGPDPYNDRRFYCTIKRNRQGKLVVT